MVRSTMGRDCSGYATSPVTRGSPNRAQRGHRSAGSSRAVIPRRVSRTSVRTGDRWAHGPIVETTPGYRDGWRPGTALFTGRPPTSPPPIVTGDWAEAVPLLGGSQPPGVVFTGAAGYERRRGCRCRGPPDPARERPGPRSSRSGPGRIDTGHERSSHRVLANRALSTGVSVGVQSGYRPAVVPAKRDTGPPEHQFFQGWVPGRPHVREVLSP